MAKLLVTVEEIKTLSGTLVMQHWDKSVPSAVGIADPDDDEEGTVELALDKDDHA